MMVKYMLLRPLDSWLCFRSVCHMHGRFLRAETSVKMLVS